MERNTNNNPEKIKEIKGEIRGFAIKSDGEYIRKIKGEGGVEELEKEMEKMGFPMKFSQVKDTEFLPAIIAVVPLVAMQRAFGFGDKEIREVCAFQTKIPLIARLFPRYVYSIPRIRKVIQNMWGKYWTEGEISFPEFNETEKYAVIRLRNFDTHPILCRCLEGYFSNMAKMTLGEEKADCVETKCPSKGDEYHEFLIKW